MIHPHIGLRAVLGLKLEILLSWKHFGSVAWLILLTDAACESLLFTYRTMPIDIFIPETLYSSWTEELLKKTETTFSCPIHEINLILSY